MARITQIAFLRNGTLCTSYESAKNSLHSAMNNVDQDGSVILARYKDIKNNNVKTIIGVVHIDKNTKTLSIFKPDDIIVEKKDNNENSLHYSEIYRAYN